MIKLLFVTTVLFVLMSMNIILGWDNVTTLTPSTDIVYSVDIDYDYVYIGSWLK